MFKMVAFFSGRDISVTLKKIPYTLLLFSFLFLSFFPFVALLFLFMSESESMIVWLSLGRM